ncbi:hypothetical protein [Methylobacter sp. S3L5C]|uniref:hypothetical protein n=1 Tax=Methylobacter sp. S3L5C TaxID=2839024 RepID=UPI001FAC4D09|nr:hypothetical protein [Methylobacter sp. S3L5C]UOA07044.1 hypothetical protein KKZ03_11995 [Methylobacter sp. S3L5C]
MLGLIKPKKGTRLDQLAPTATRLTAVQGEIDPNALLNFPKKFRRLRDTERPDLPDHGFSSITLQVILLPQM